MTYSIVTIGGTVIESGLTKDEAEMLAAEKGSYYHIREDEAAKAGENAPTFAEMIEAMTPPVWNASSNDAEPAEIEANASHWNDVINEGGEGYQSGNW